MGARYQLVKSSMRTFSTFAAMLEVPPSRSRIFPLMTLPIASPVEVANRKSTPLVAISVL